MATNAQLETDTIVAIATPPGRGGIGIVRLSGPSSLTIAQGIVTLRHPPQSHRAALGPVLDLNGQRIDDALLTWFAAPRSYTGEEVVEIATHGAPVVLDAVVRQALHHGARLARPGEFTERAFLHGRLDLSAAEAVRDLIDAQTLTQARLAAQQMGGALAREIAPVKHQLIHLIAALEAGIDFAEDDLDTLSGPAIAARIAPLLPPLHALEQSFARTRHLRDGLTLAIVGKPNAGKSSLFNRLLGRDRAIVTPIPGTTRDTVSERLDLDGIPIVLLDTAGLRITDDDVERIGVERTYEAIADADLILHILDASEAAEDAVHTTTTHPVAGPPQSPAEDALLRSHSRITVQNKIDLLSPHAKPATPNPPNIGTAPTSANVSPPSLVHNPSSGNVDPRLSQIGQGQAALSLPSAGSLFRTSALTGEGIDALRTHIVQWATGPEAANTSATLTNTRQHGIIHAACVALERAAAAAGNVTPHEMLLLDLYDTLQLLDTLTGETTTESVLHQIFSTFCIGK